MHYQSSPNQTCEEIIEELSKQFGTYRKVINNNRAIKSEFTAWLFVEFVRIFVQNKYCEEKTKVEYSAFINQLDHAVFQSDGTGSLDIDEIINDIKDIHLESKMDTDDENNENEDTMDIDKDEDVEEIVVGDIYHYDSVSPRIIFLFSIIHMFLFLRNLN